MAKIAIKTALTFAILFTLASYSTLMAQEQPKLDNPPVEPKEEQPLPPMGNEETTPPNQKTDSTEEKTEPPKEPASANAIPLERYYADKKAPSIFRRILSHVNFGIYTGAGAARAAHRLDGYIVDQAPGGHPPTIISKDGSQSYANWTTEAGPNEATPALGNYQISSDTTNIGFYAWHPSVPIFFTAHFQITRWMRLGLGYGWEYIGGGKYKPTGYADKINGYEINKGQIFRKYYIQLSGLCYGTDNYSVYTDFQIGMQKYISDRIFYNLGVTVERNISEYIALYARVALEYKDYAVPTVPQPIKHDIFNLPLVGIGATYRIPELPRCFIPDCHIQINHSHGNKSYRSRRHKIYKKQNPGYGENHPE